MNTKNKAIVCILISAFGFSIMNLCVKLSGDLPSIEKSFFRNLVAAIIAFILLYRSKAGFSCKKENLPALILRAVLGTIGLTDTQYIWGFYEPDGRVLCVINLNTNKDSQ